MTALPRGKHLIDFLASRPEFVGIGKATASKLWQRFGTDLYSLLGNGDTDALSLVVDPNIAAILVEAWRFQQSLADCVVFFDEVGVDNRFARKALDFWGDQSVAKVRENPYRLLTVCSWHQVDQVAIRLDIKMNDPRRLVAAVEGVLYDRLDRKHTWCSEAALVDGVRAWLKADHRAALEAISLAVSDGAAIAIDGGYQPAGAAYMERFIENRIAGHISLGGPDDLFLDGITPADVELFLQEFRSSVQLTEEQSAAVQMAMTNNFSLLVGGAGVGKTTALKAINAAARHFGMQVFQLAVAGRAASRIAAATGQPAQTIASWLRGAAENKIKTGRHTLVIIDEASMLDLPTLYRILFHLPENAPLLLVGDTSQLPPIGFGLTLHRLILEDRIPKTELTKILRATEETGIPSVSRTIREGKEPEIVPYGQGLLGCSFLSATEESILDAIEDVTHDLTGEEIQIVAPTYKGPCGIDAINKHFHALNPARLSSAQHGYAEGDPCIWLVNDCERRLWNGSMGRVIGFEGHVLLAEFDGAVHRIEPPEMERIDLAYCISVHKAQGSQFKNVIMPIWRTRNLDRAMIYTAVTRATDRVIIIGAREVLARAALSRATSTSRDVALRLRD